MRGDLQRYDEVMFLVKDGEVNGGCERNREDVSNVNVERCW